MKKFFVGSFVFIRRVTVNLVDVISTLILFGQRVNVYKPEGTRLSLKGGSQDYLSFNVLCYLSIGIICFVTVDGSERISLVCVYKFPH